MDWLICFPPKIVVALCWFLKFKYLFICLVFYLVKPWNPSSTICFRANFLMLSWIMSDGFGCVSNPWWGKCNAVYSSHCTGSKILLSGLSIMLIAPKEFNTDFRSTVFLFMVELDAHSLGLEAMISPSIPLLWERRKFQLSYIAHWHFGSPLLYMLNSL